MNDVGTPAFIKAAYIVSPCSIGTLVSASPCTMSEGADLGETKRIGENLVGALRVHPHEHCANYPPKTVRRFPIGGCVRAPSEPPAANSAWEVSLARSKCGWVGEPYAVTRDLCLRNAPYWVLPLEDGSHFSGSNATRQVRKALRRA